MNNENAYLDSMYEYKKQKLINIGMRVYSKYLSLINLQILLDVSTT